MGSYNFNGNIPAISQVPGATHGGVLGSAQSMVGQLPAGPKPGSDGAATIKPVHSMAPPPGIMPKADPQAITNRAVKRRDAAQKRRATKRAKRAKEEKEGVK